jgi:ATP-dependent helicase/nuclease subunit B
MATFLEEVCDHIFQNHQHETGDICIITPNRRAGLFFRKYFSQKVTQPLWAPQVLSIEDFVNQVTGLNICDNISLMFEFYKVYCEIEKQNAMSIDGFFRWATVLLRDFDEIDSQLEDPSILFEHLKDLKRIDTWNPDGSPPTPFQQRYLKFFEHFELYHSGLVKHLLDQGLAYQGLSFRLAAAKIKAEHYIPPFRKIIFAGFNALTYSEETIINSLVKRKQASLLIDSDPYYLDDNMHEAGHFIRRYNKKNGWPIPNGRPSWFASEPKNISVLGITNNVNQARIAGNLLNNNPELTADENTAIVLANENLLIPVLYSLPSTIKNVNVTMGYPLRKTNLYGFFNALFQLHLTPARIKQSSGKDFKKFYHKDITRFFSHQATALVWDIEKGSEYCNSLIRELASSNYSFCSFSELAALSKQQDVFTLKFSFLDSLPAADLKQVSAIISRLCEELSQCFLQKAASVSLEIKQSPWFLDYEALYYFSSIMRRLQALTGQWNVIDSLKTYYMLFRQVVSESRLAFSGEPLEGLQIMGMLETRNLDFSNIILLSTNEDILPKGKTNNSFIPFEVKKIFGLQVHTDKDSTYAYHFYRLLQRAKNIYLVYNTQKGGIGSQEKSRFITQLMMELPEFNPLTRISEHIVSLSPSGQRTDFNVIIAKTPEIMQRLQQMAASGFSPSALGSYINCPLQFYLQKVARLQEADHVEETLEVNTMGTIIHAALEELYSPFINRAMTPGDIKKIGFDVKTVLMKKFKEEFKGGNIESGKNLLLTRVAERMINNFLSAEKKWMEKNPDKILTIIKLEEKLQASLMIPSREGNLEVLIKGFADRIDKTGNTIRIIDYKTGKVEASDLRIIHPECITEDPKMSKAFQLLCYTWLYKQENDNGHEIEPGIFSFRNLSAGILTLDCNQSSGLSPKEIADSFEDQLKELLLRIMEPSIDFTQTDNPDNCKYCPFTVLCRK